MENRSDVRRGGFPIEKVDFLSNPLYLYPMKRFDAERELNEALTPISIFAETYNKTLPLGFPRASEKTLREFQIAYPLLFKTGDGWSIDKHRKRFMDWHMTHPVGAGEKRERWPKKLERLKK